MDLMKVILTVCGSAVLGFLSKVLFDWIKGNKKESEYNYLPGLKDMLTEMRKDIARLFEKLDNFSQNYTKCSDFIDLKNKHEVLKEECIEKFSKQEMINSQTRETLNHVEKRKQ